VAPEIMAAILAANNDTAPSYGADAASTRLGALFADLFECQVRVFPVVSGTAANALALACLTPPWGTIYCHDTAHIVVDECGAPEFFTGGARLVTLAGVDGRLVAADLEAALAVAGAGNVHHMQPAAVSITQASELGTVYRPAEVAAIAEVCRRHAVRLHMDGSRFANALARLGGSPADLTWRVGVEALSFGATKNGALAAEAVVFFDPLLAATFAYRQKRGGHLLAKTRFISAQLEAYLKDDLWLRHARHANDMAARFVAGLKPLRGVQLLYPVEGNEIFLRLPAAAFAALQAAGFAADPWDETGLVRFVTAFDTDPADLDALLAALAGALAGALDGALGGSA
jgi:threonine aldolase